MGVALDAGADLGAVAACYVAIGLLLLTVAIVEALAKALNVGILGTHPFAFLGNLLHDHVVTALNGAIAGLEHTITGLMQGVREAYYLIAGIPLGLGLQLVKGVSWLWDKKIDPLIKAMRHDLSVAITAQENAITGLGTDLANGAIAVTSYVDNSIDALRGDIQTQITLATSGLETALHNAVSELRDTLEHDISRQVGSAESLAASAVDTLAAAESTALSAAENLGDEAIADISGLLGGSDLYTVAGIIASIPALGLLVHVIADEAGLGNSECRNKVKGICGTGSGAWGNLLADLAPLLVVLSLKELHDDSAALVGEVGGWLREFAA